MKKTATIISVMAIAFAALISCQNQPQTASEDNSTAVPAAPQGSIVYFNLDRILSEYDMANDLSSVLQTKMESIDQEVTRRGNKLQSDINSFQEKIDKGLLTRSTAEAQNVKLQEQRSDFETYYTQKQQEMQEEQAVTMNQIADAIKVYIDKFNEEKKYAMIIATQGDILPQPVVVGDPSLDITDILLEGLNAEYVQSKNEN